VGARPRGAPNATGNHRRSIGCAGRAFAVTVYDVGWNWAPSDRGGHNPGTLMAQDLGGDATAHRIGTPALARAKRWLEPGQRSEPARAGATSLRSRVVPCVLSANSQMGGPSNTDLPLLPQVLTG
jgi:hypothetical protein